MFFPTSTQYSEGVNILVQHHRRFWWLWCNLQSYSIFIYADPTHEKYTHTSVLSEYYVALRFGESQQGVRQRAGVTARAGRHRVALTGHRGDR